MVRSFTSVVELHLVTVELYKKSISYGVAYLRIMQIHVVLMACIWIIWASIWIRAKISFQNTSTIRWAFSRLSEDQWSVSTFNISFYKVLVIDYITQPILALLRDLYGWTLIFIWLNFPVDFRCSYQFILLLIKRAKHAANSSAQSESLDVFTTVTKVSLLKLCPTIKFV